MKKLPPSTITLALLSVGAMLLAVLYAYLFSSLSDAGEKHQNFAGEIKNAEKIIREEKENSAKLSAYFIKDGEQADFVSGIEASCAELSLECDNRFLSESAADVGPIKILSMGISAKGSFENITALLARFESSPYPIVLSRVSLSSGTGWEGSFEFSVPVLIIE